MKVLWYFAFLGLIGTTFGGGESSCGELLGNFLSLLQVSEEKNDRFLSYTNYTVTYYPAMTNSSIIFYFCELNVTTSILATGLNQLTGLNFWYIFDILIGNISPPFDSPLDCIESELLSFYLYTQNIAETIIPELESQNEESPINSNSPCNATIQFVSHYYQASKNLTEMKKEINILDATAFTSIGQKNLYIEHTYETFSCQRNSLVGRVVDLLNGNKSLVSSYLSNETSILPPPYSCIQGIIDSTANQINDRINQFNNTLNDPLPRCEPFLSQFIAFHSIWTDYITNLTNQAISNAMNYPVLVPSLIDDFNCELDIMVTFAANAINILSGIDSDIIYDILTGSIAPPFVQPLDCIESYLNVMKFKISGMKNSFVVQLQLLRIQSSANTSTCAAAYESLASYVSVMISIIRAKGPYVNDALNKFATIGFDELYLDSIASMIYCVPKILGSYIGSVLNGISSAVTAYISGQTSKLPYPFSCVKVLINIYSSLFNQAIVNFSINVPVDLSLPNIPTYRG